MFLVEAALGKEHGVTHDMPRLTQAPPGHDSVIARGRQVGWGPTGGCSGKVGWGPTDGCSRKVGWGPTGGCSEEVGYLKPGWYG